MFGIDWRRVARTLGPLAAILAFFFVSGACGLLYQVVWTRKLVLLFGTTAYAVSTVLSIFFIGLGAGSLWGGRIADRTARPLFVYGVFELLIGVWAIVFILLIGSGETAVLALLRVATSSRMASIAVRAALAFAFLIVPVVLMGATLPLLSKFVNASGRVRGIRIGALYSINTAGAVLGCAAAGFAILPSLGYTRTTLIGAAANAGIGLLAIAVSGFGLRVSGLGELDDAPDGAARSSGKMTIVLLAFAVSGACALALEVLWTRLLCIVFLGTTYAFTTMLTTILCGIALGSAFASAFVDRLRRPRLWFGAVEILIGASCLLMLPLFAGLPARLSEIQVQAGYDWERVAQAKFVLSFLVLFAPTFLFGMTFPLVVKTATSTGAQLGRDIGRLYSANTFGGVMGAIAGGYILIPWLGTHGGIVALSFTLFMVGIVIAVSTPGARIPIKAALIVTGCALMAAGLHAAPRDISLALNDGYIPKSDTLVRFREGVEGTVAVSEPKDNASGSDRTLWINAVQATASIEKGVKMNRFEGVLPLLFDRDPKTALFMCFGSGVTVGTLGLYDFDRIDAVEISKDVLESAPAFAKDNFKVYENPRVRFSIDDGRNFLLTKRERYDVITFEPMPLALAGVSTFYTREYYTLCLNHLTPGGLVSQWIPLHSLDADTVQSLLFTFTSVFPEYCAWFVNADLFVIGSNQPIRIDYARAEQRLSAPVIADALHAVGFDDLDEVMACFFMGKANVDAFAKGGTVMTDDRPWAEFVAPKLMHLRTVDKSLERIAPFFESPTTLLAPLGDRDATVRAALDRRHAAKAKGLRGLEMYYGGSFGSEPEVFFKEALAVDPHDYSAQYYLKEIAIARAKTYVRWDEGDKAIAALTDALKYAPDLAELHLALGDTYFDLHQLEQAKASYAAYLQLGGTAPRAKERSGS